MNDPELLLFLLNFTLECHSLNLLSLLCLHFVALPPQLLGFVQLTHLEHELLLSPHIH
jgi:hypothetical protein